MNEQLTPDRLFSAPSLAGDLPSDLKVSPCGEFAAFRAPSEDDQNRLNLHRVMFASGTSELWIEADTVAQTSADVTSLTAEERADRERRRDFSHGIREYFWQPGTDAVLLPMDGQAYLLEDGRPRPLCPPGTRQSGFLFSPCGHMLAYVRDGNVHILTLATQQEVAVTHGTRPDVVHGLPDFLAAEEMHRFAGMWWSLDSTQLYYTMVDNTPVRESFRLELDAAGAKTIPQRYPYAGEQNPRVSLWQYNRVTDEHTEIWNDAQEAYLARCCPVSEGVVLQVQDRLQHSLLYRLYPQTGGRPETLYEERSDTWVSLSDDFREISGHRFVLTEETSGTRRVNVIHRDGTIQALAGPTHVNQILAADDEAVWATGWHDSPVQNHLFRLDTAGKDFRQLTGEDGWHEISLSIEHGCYLDRHSATRKPLSVSYRTLDGTSSRTLFRNDVQNDHPYANYATSHCYASFKAFDAADGQKIHCRITPPSGTGAAGSTGRHPTIVYVYGGPGAQKVRDEWSPLLVQLFAQNGFGVLEIDNRGSANRGRRFEAPLYRRMGSIEVIDQVAGLAVLEQESWADMQRVGIFGHSYGGYMTLMCLCQAPQAFRSGVAVAPVCDWRLYDSHYTERYMGLPEDNPQGYEQGNVLTHLCHLDSPLLLMHGMADDNVLFTHSTMIMNELQRLQKPFQLMTYPGAKHSMQEPHVATLRDDSQLFPSIPGRDRGIAFRTNRYRTTDRNYLPSGWQVHRRPRHGERQDTRKCVPGMTVRWCCPAWEPERARESRFQSAIYRPE